MSFKRLLIIVWWFRRREGLRRLYKICSGKCFRCGFFPRMSSDFYRYLHYTGWYSIRHWTGAADGSFVRPTQYCPSSHYMSITGYVLIEIYIIISLFHTGTCSVVDGAFRRNLLNSTRIFRCLGLAQLGFCTDHAEEQLALRKNALFPLSCLSRNQAHQSNIQLFIWLIVSGRWNLHRIKSPRRTQSSTCY